MGMLNALDINTKAIIASGMNRSELARVASEKVGREGFCIRAAHEAQIVLPKNWATTDGEWFL
jgi:hypothetical protein